MCRIVLLVTQYKEHLHYVVRSAPRRYERDTRRKTEGIEQLTLLIFDLNNVRQLLIEVQHSVGVIMTWIVALLGTHILYLVNMSAGFQPW